jgi:hypothetical protein
VPSIARRGLLTLAPVVGAAVVLVGCSTSKQLDMGKLETALVDQYKAANPSATNVKADCPSGKDVKVAANVSFECTLTADGQTVTYTVTQKDAEGNVDIAQKS